MKKEIKKRFSEAVKLKNRRQFEAARTVLLELSGQDTKSKVILATLGDVHWEMGALEEAACVFKRAIELDPKWEPVSLGLFHVLWQLGRRVEAMKEAVRFQSISDSADYRAIVKEINEKL
jgi:predicted Zn-dependent protease